MMCLHSLTYERNYKMEMDSLEHEVLQELNMKDRAEVVTFLKRLWNEQSTACPKCGEVLTLMHKKAKKSNCDWKCPSCNAVYKTIHILDSLNE